MTSLSVEGADDSGCRPSWRKLLPHGVSTDEVQAKLGKILQGADQPHSEEAVKCCCVRPGSAKRRGFSVVYCGGLVGVQGGVTAMRQHAISVLLSGLLQHMQESLSYLVPYIVKEIYSSAASTPIAAPSRPD